MFISIITQQRKAQISPPLGHLFYPEARLRQHNDDDDWMMIEHEKKEHTTIPREKK